MNLLLNSADVIMALISCSVGRLKRPMAEICVKAVLAVADLERRDVNLDLIKVACTALSNDNPSSTQQNAV